MAKINININLIFFLKEFKLLVIIHLNNLNS